MAHVLAIDDDAAVTHLLKRGLTQEGFVVDTANSGLTGLHRALDNPPDLIILDIMMPDMDGLEVLARVRATDLHLPVLVLTARDELADQVKGLEAGATDYVIKPFEFSVLLARVRALLRQHDVGPCLCFDDLTLDRAGRQALRRGRVINLTPLENQLLAQFLAHPRQVFSKESLLADLWGFNFVGHNNLVEVYVRQLRQKLEAGGEPRLIHTVFGSGYVLRSEGDALVVTPPPGDSLSPASGVPQADLSLVW